jgi:DNA-binding NarL/FixJ family response regulator
MLPNLNVCILDDHRLFVDGLSRIMKDIAFIMKVYPCTNYSQLQGVLGTDKIQVLFLDLNLGRSRYTGFTVCTELKNYYPALHIAVLAEHDNPAAKRKARLSGASAYFTKNASPQKLESFLLALNKGNHENFVAEKYTGSSAPQPADTFDLKEHLTGREIEVFNLIAGCCETSEIKQRLNISYDTLRTHRDNVIKKLNLKNAAQIIQFAYRHKLVL